MTALSLITRQRRRARAYQALFGGGRDGPNLAAAEVLADLRRFCHDQRTTAKATAHGLDPIAMAMAEGRREVFLRICQYLRLTPEQLDRLTEEEGTFNG